MSAHTKMDQQCLDEIHRTIGTSLIDWVRRHTDAAQGARYTRALFLARKKAVADVIELAQRSDAASDARAHVYFVQIGTTGSIKIGTSTRLKARIRALRTGAPGTLTLLAVTDGGRWVESLLHTLFSHVRVKGEWFHPTPELLEYIAEVVAIKGSPEEISERELETLFEKRRNMRVIA